MNPQRFDRFSYVQNNPLRYQDPTGLSFTYCDPQGELLCDEDQTHAIPDEGGQEDPPSENPDPDPDDSEDDEYKTRTEKCQDCDCKDRPDIKALKKLKRDVTIGKYGVTIAYAILCGIAAAMLCIETGPGAVMC